MSKASEKLIVYLRLTQSGHPAPALSLEDLETLLEERMVMETLLRKVVHLPETEGRDYGIPDELLERIKKALGENLT